MSKTAKKRTTAGKKAGVGRAAKKRGNTRRDTERTPTKAATNQRATKKDTILALLRREEGATLAELTNATGWQAHSVRGFISGTVRKNLRLAVERVTREDGTEA